MSAYSYIAGEPPKAETRHRSSSRPCYAHYLTYGGRCLNCGAGGGPPPLCIIGALEGEKPPKKPDYKQQAKELLAALENLVQTFVDGSHYNTQNPYTRPQVKAALAAIAKAKGEDK